MRPWREIWKENKTTYMNTMVSFSVNLFGTVLPLIIGALLFAIFDSWKGWTTFLRGGEFYLYSTSLCTASAYVLWYFKDSNTSFVAVCFWLSVLLLLPATALYAATVAANQLDSGGKLKLNETILIVTSLVLVIASSFLFFVAQLIQNKKAPDVAAESRSSVEDLKQAIGDE